jgi:hypothetical protein
MSHTAERRKGSTLSRWGQHWGHLAGRSSQLFININRLQALFGSARTYWSLYLVGSHSTAVISM